MIQAKSGDTVKVHYTRKFEDGTQFSTSFNDNPLRFTIGEGQVIPGLEQAVISTPIPTVRAFMRLYEHSATLFHKTTDVKVYKTK